MFDDLLALQSLDLRIQQLNHRRNNLPEREAVETNAGARSELAQRRHVLEAQRTDLVRSQHRLEDEVAQVDQRATDHEAQLYGGGVTSPRELQAMQDDIEGLRRRQRTLEDKVLEVMEELEPVTAALGELDAADAGLGSEADALHAALSVAEADIAAELDAVTSERTPLVGAIDAGVLADYERLRAQLGGIAIARLEGGACGGCHLSLSAVELDRIRQLPAEERVTCEECGRLLVR